MSSETYTQPEPQAPDAQGPIDIGPPSMAKRSWIGFTTIVRKEITRFMRIWTQTLLPPAMTMTLYFLIFGEFIGSQLREMNGVGYMEFIMPGLVMMSVITASFTNVVGSFFSSKFQHNVEELLVSPLPNIAILGGYVAGGVARAILVGSVVTIVSLLFLDDVSIAHPFLTIAIVVLTAVLFSIGGFINAMYARKFDDISIVPTFVLAPLTYLGGVFYSISALPDWAQTMSKANPILYMVNAFRYGILGDRLESPDVPVTGAFVVVCLFIVAFALWALHQLKRGTGIRS